MRSGEEAYTIRTMIRPRQALRTGQKPFMMIEQRRRLKIPPDVRVKVSAALLNAETRSDGQS
jgi:hypothetical protein